MDPITVPTDMLNSGVKRKKQEANLACTMCEKKFTFMCNLRRHLKNIHKKQESCMVEGCHYVCSNKQEMIMHCEHSHSPNYEREDLEFKSLEDFYTWKLKEEVQNFVCFTKRRGDIEMLSSIHQHYICALSRRVAAKEKVAKMDLFCPARMLLKESKENGSVRVTYYKTHSHKLTFSQSQHNPIPECLRHEIKEKLKAGLSVDQIYCQLRRKHKSQLAVSVAIFNRLQRIDKSQICMIQRAMAKKGALQRKCTEEVVQEVDTGADPCVSNDDFEVIEGEIVHDGEVEMDIEAANSFAKDAVLNEIGSQPADSICVQEISAEVEQSMNSPEVFKAYELTHPDNSPEIISQFFQPSPTSIKKTVEGNGSPVKVQDMFKKIMTLLENEDVKKTVLPYVEESMKELLHICQDEKS